MKIRLIERMLWPELTAHLGYEAGAEPPAAVELSRSNWWRAIVGRWGRGRFDRRNIADCHTGAA